MNAQYFVTKLEAIGVDFFTGVPDSLLKPFNDYLMDAYGISKKHIIATNEGSAAALAAGHHLATGSYPCIYLQNSGLGNIVNPVTSLLHIYEIPSLFIIGWRGEPDVEDEPQHALQGQITLQMLDTMGIAYTVLNKDTSEADFSTAIESLKALLTEGKSVAIVVKKGSLSFDAKISYTNNHATSREEILRLITEKANGDIIVSTTGKTSRELFEIREQQSQSHKYDFLTVGSMGHSSSIALGIALSKPHTRVWCLDGDGAALMHMGALAMIGASSPAHFIHVIINNGAHESVGGQPTVAQNLNFGEIALACGYKAAYHVASIAELTAILAKMEGQAGPILLEIKSAIGSRADLGRPTKSPVENKISFMDYVRECT